MRFIKQFTRQYTGDLRVVKKFLIFPLTINHETRWLETAFIVQNYVSYNGLEDDGEWWNYRWAKGDEATTMKVKDEQEYWREHDEGGWPRPCSARPYPDYDYQKIKAKYHR